MLDFELAHEPMLDIEIGYRKHINASAHFVTDAVETKLACYI